MQLSQCPQGANASASSDVHEDNERREDAEKYLNRRQGRQCEEKHVNVLREINFATLLHFVHKTQHVVHYTNQISAEAG
jgi:hypothetical protein